MARGSLRLDSTVHESAHGPQAIRARFHMWLKDLQQETRDVAMLVAEIGAEQMQLTIKTVNTTKSGPGRILDGDMYSDVRARPLGGGGWGKWEFGWIEQEQHYYGLQEEGFYHVRAQRDIPGMFAFAAASGAAEDLFYSEMRRIVP